MVVKFNGNKPFKMEEHQSNKLTTKCFLCGQQAKSRIFYDGFENGNCICCNCEDQLKGMFKDYLLAESNFNKTALEELVEGLRNETITQLDSQIHKEGYKYAQEVSIVDDFDDTLTLDIEFVREMSTRNDYLMATLNPDDPSLPVYKEFVNRSRPYQKYACDVPAEIMKELTEEPVPNWRYWFFTFRDNLSLTDEDIKRKMAAAPKGTKLYKNKILGLRGRATGLVFDLQKRNILTAEQAKAFTFVYFSAGLDTAYSQSSPDTIAFTFVGITADRKCVTLDEEVYNNRDRQVPLTPSDIPKIFTAFLEKNRRTWGFARDVYIDSADQATILECQKFGRLTGSIYNFIPAFKKTKIIDRIHLQSAWLAAGDFYILEHCKEYAGELNIYSWKEDKAEPEDGNDHLTKVSEQGQEHF